MTTNEEKIKAFLKDAYKVEALGNDEKFMDKISGGQATPETYKEEFKKFDITLSDDEANEIAKTTEKLTSIKPEQLDDISLKNVSGGYNKGALIAGGVISGVSLLAGTGCAITELIYQKKIDEAIEAGNIESARNYKKIRTYVNYGKWGAIGLGGIGGTVLSMGGLCGFISDIINPTKQKAKN